MHKHALAMGMYALDASQTDKPWELWEATASRNEEWTPLCCHPLWDTDTDYRRKPKEVNIEIVVGQIDQKLSEDIAQFRSKTAGRVEALEKIIGYEATARARGDSELQSRIKRLADDVQVDRTTRQYDTELLQSHVNRLEEIVTQLQAGPSAKSRSQTNVVAEEPHEATCWRAYLEMVSNTYGVNTARGAANAVERYIADRLTP